MKRPWYLATACVLLLAGALGACGGDDSSEMNGVMTAGAGAPAAGSAAVGGAPAGAAGNTVPVTAGAAAPVAGSMAAAGGGAGVPTCATAKKGTPSEIHAAAAAALLPMGTNKGCAFSSCHDASSKKANLTLLEAPLDLKMQIVGKTACEVPSYQIVDPSGGDAALAKSWLWQKLTAAVAPTAALMPKPEWGAAVETCGQDPGQMFGIRMPKGGGTALLTESKLLAVRDWICAGAPGP